MTEQLCPHCGRPQAECYERVDERFPARAVEAYKDAGYEFAATCPQGQAHDVRHTRGWCWDRARFDKYWKGVPMTPEERRGFKPVEAL
jgi:hypothetical protein